MTGLQGASPLNGENVSEQKAVPVLQLNWVISLMKTGSVGIKIHPQISSTKLDFILKMESAGE
jgi:hypothetical protein